MVGHSAGGELAVCTLLPGQRLGAGDTRRILVSFAIPWQQILSGHHAIAGPGRGLHESRDADGSVPRGVDIRNSEILQVGYKPADLAADVAAKYEGNSEWHST